MGLEEGLGAAGNRPCMAAAAAAALVGWRCTSPPAALRRPRIAPLSHMKQVVVSLMLAEGQALRTQLHWRGNVEAATQQLSPGASLPSHCSSGSVELARRSARAITSLMASNRAARALELSMAIYGC